VEVTGVTPLYARNWNEAPHFSTGTRDPDGRHTSRPEFTAGKKLVRYDITNATSAAGGGYRFTVTATIEDRGTPETKIFRYTVYKDRALSGGRWCVMGSW